MLLLDNPIQNYAWGSRTELAQLLGRPPAAQPEAELWIGAHAKAPSRLGDGRTLLDAIRTDPEGMLGSSALQRFGGELPFLLKVLAVASPLSLQAHPNLEQARVGFAREELAGIPLSASARTYKDSNHKPELLCALTPFEALSGFRPAEESASLLESLGVTSTDLPLQLRRAHREPLRRAFSSLMTLGGEERMRVIADVLGRCEQARDRPGPFAASIRWAATLGQRYPGDIGAVASLFLNHLTLAPLQAVYLEAGRLHAYLSGTAVEIMANSDNVLRGGLTEKHVDVPELLQVLQFDSPAVCPAACSLSGSGEATYQTPAPEFRLSCIDLLAGRAFAAEVEGPEVLLCVEGQTEIEVSNDAPPLGGSPALQRGPRVLRRGQAGFLPAKSRGYRLLGEGRVFRARVG
jgi:mannose-6-phosphate isomerase